jgi:hypothetical protein
MAFGRTRLSGSTTRTDESNPQCCSHDNPRQARRDNSTLAAPYQYGCTANHSSDTHRETDSGKRYLGDTKCLRDMRLVGMDGTA